MHDLGSIEAYIMGMVCGADDRKLEKYTIWGRRESLPQKFDGLGAHGALATGTETRGAFDNESFCFNHELNNSVPAPSDNVSTGSLHSPGAPIGNRGMIKSHRSLCCDAN